ncbi:MAG: 2-oxo-4-hydroxy-4-carboxy-5-ureidoimidazoline decarboxylase [Ornithinimicrobium sp.]
MSQTPVVRKKTHPVDEVLPIPKLAVYGFQHVLAFYAGAVLVPILVARALGLSDEQLIHLINADLFTCGIASIIQAAGFWKIGVKLPLLQGVTFTAVSPMIAIGLAAGGGTDGLLAIYGSVIVAGLFTLFMAPYFSQLLRFFPSVVTGTVILIIGIALLPVAAADVVESFGPQDMAGEPVFRLIEGNYVMKDAVEIKNIAYALGTLGLIVAIQRFFKGFLQTIAVLVGLVVGTLVAWTLGDAEFDAVGSADLVGVTTPFFFGIPTFSITAILSMIIVMIITAVETTGDVFATGEIVNKRVGKKDIAAALRADGLATTLGGVLNSFPYTCFAENVGLVRLTQVKSRWVVVSAGFIMIVLGSLPKAAAVVAGIPHPVLGGAALVMFATVAVVGIQTLSKVDFNDYRNVVIVGTSLGLAMLVTAQPYIANAFVSEVQIIFGSGITLGALTAIILNVVFFHVGPSMGPAVAGTPGRSISLNQVNEMTEDEFVATFGGLFQGPVWPVRKAYGQRPFADTPDLRAAFQEALLGGTADEQRELMGAYPNLGVDQELSEESATDQAWVGLDYLSEEEAAEFAELSADYQAKFGIPFIVCLRDLDKRDQVLRLGWRRMENSSGQEHVAALNEVSRIAGYRFEDLVADANPISSSRTQRFEQLH